MSARFAPELLASLRARYPLAQAVRQEGLKLTKDGPRLKGCCPFHPDKTPSFTIYPDQHFKCFGCGAKGDIFEFVAKQFSVEFVQAVERVADAVNFPLPDTHTRSTLPLSQPASEAAEGWVPMAPPTETPEPPAARLKCTTLHTYREPDGKPLHYVRRVERENGRKAFYPLTYGTLNGQAGWHDKPPATPRQLYGLHQLAARPDAPVLIVEGEKSCDAAAQLFPDMVVITWQGGSKADGHADWTPLKRRSDITIWPDNDGAGHAVAARIAARLQGSRVLRIDDMGAGEDAADLHVDDPSAWLREHMPLERESEPEPMPEGDRAEEEPGDDPGYLASLQAEASAAMSAVEWNQLRAREAGEVVHASPEAKAAAGKNLLWRRAQGWNIRDIPMRPWIAPGYLLRGSVTVISGPGSAGKSSLVIAWSTAIALGAALERFKLKKPDGRQLRVLSYNVEDDEFEQIRRYEGAFERMGVTDPALWQGNLVFCGPAEVGTLITVNQRDGKILVNTPVMDELEGFIAEYRPDVAIFDPFVELHHAEENDNTSVRGVMARFRAIAKKYDMAVAILHHSRKGELVAGDPDSLRGASAIVGAARIVLTLNVMTEVEAKELGIPAHTRRNFSRLDGAKSNYAPITDAEWFERLSYHVDNGPPLLTMNIKGEHVTTHEGDGVPVMWPWKPQVLIAPSQEVLTRALEMISKGSAEGPYSPTLNDGSRSFRQVAAAIGIHDPPAQKNLLKELKKQGVEEAKYKVPRRSVKQSPKGLRTREGLPEVEWLDEEDAERTAA